MAQKPNTARKVSGMERVGKRKFGYNVSQVNEFLERAHKLYVSDNMDLTQKDIQEVSFDLERDGYVISQVDATLSRLENAVVDKATEYDIMHRGRVVWKAEIEDIYRTLLKHAKRAERQRFAPGEPKHPSYDRTQVDELVNQILDKIAISLGHRASWDTDEDILKEITDDFVSDVVFTQRVGKRGYDERQVDYYLNSCIRVLSKIESYERISKDFDISASDLHSASDSYSASDSEEKPQSSFDLSSLVKKNNSSDLDSLDSDLNKANSNNSDLPSFAATQSAQSAESKESKGHAEPTILSTSALFGDSESDLSKENNSGSDLLSSFARSSSASESASPEKQSIFAPVKHDDDDSSDTGDDMIQSATVLSNLHKASAPLPPAFPPAPKRSSVSHNIDEKTVNRNSDSAAALPPEFPPSFTAGSALGAVSASKADASKDASSASDGLHDIPVRNSFDFNQSQSLNLDIPDLSFPIMNKLGSFDDSSDDSDSDSEN
ncbi:DivIVA domain-containing protein [Gardnerella vaginalis]|uniref:Cell division protein DivIVA n=1 Tax=Gardnerella vaginalis TaxID=2702 RepID=A0A2K1SU07_GARVA|nr:DivIVA domain-containing protein [Gardnerella vaginalis]PNS42988.1 cell division protein DivIVA [Gardnerella vaginalis]